MDPNVPTARGVDQAPSLGLGLVCVSDDHTSVLFNMPTFTELSDVMSCMTALQVVSVCQKYVSILNELGAKPFQDRDAKTREGQLNHLRYMCDFILTEVHTAHDEIELQKSMRWLGFVQGAFFSLGIRTIDEMRDDNR